MEFSKVNPSLLVTTSSFLSQNGIIGVDLKANPALNNNENAEGIYGDGDSMKSADNSTDVTVVPTTVPIYLFTPSTDDVVQAYSVSDDGVLKANQSSTSNAEDSDQMLKDDASNLNSFASCINLEIPYFEAVSSSADSVITMPSTSTVPSIQTHSTNEGAPSELCEEMIRSFVVGGSSTLGKQSANSQLTDDQCVGSGTYTEHNRNNPVSMAEAIISASVCKHHGERSIEKQVIIQIEDDHLVNEVAATQESQSQYQPHDDDVVMLNSDEDNEILVTFLGNKADMGNQSAHPITTSLTAEEILQSQPVLHMDCEVVKEIVDINGVVQRRVITTQTKPLRGMKHSKKLKGKERSSVANEYFGKEVQIEIKADEPDPVVSRQFKCTRCGLKFVSAETLDFHTRCHTVEDKHYKCFNCDFTSPLWTKMHQHLFTHGVEKPHKCSQCSFSCVNKSDLTSHMFVHSKTKDWLCHKCNRLFKHRRNMVAHLRVCAGLDSSGKLKKADHVHKFICKVCNKELSNKRNLDKHMEIHSDVRPFVCNTCGHATRLKESLIMHKRLHTGEKPFKCDQCEYSTPDKSSLRRHKRRHTNEKPHCCSFCNYKSIQKHCLDTHIRSKHTGEQFVCGLCHFMTHDRYALNHHFKQHQNNVLTQDGQQSATAIINIDGNVLTTLHDVQPTSMSEEKPTENQDLLLTVNNVASREKEQEKVATSAAEVISSLRPEVAASLSSDCMQNLYVVNNNAETRTIELSGEEGMLLQQIQEPGDLVFLQESGEIVIKKHDGRIVIIQQQEEEIK